MPLSFSHFVSAAVETDYRRFRDDLKARGKILDSIAEDQIHSFVRALYAVCGRVDFWPLRSDHNIGTDSTVLSFHGRSGTISGGATWSPDGIVFSGGSTFISLPAVPLNIWAGFGVVKPTNPEIDVTRGLLYLLTPLPANIHWVHDYGQLGGNVRTAIFLQHPGPTQFAFSGAIRTGEFLSSAVYSDDVVTRIYEDGTLQASRAETTVRRFLATVGTRVIGQGTHGPIALYVPITTKTDPQPLHAIARDTICSGLGLL